MGNFARSFKRSMEMTLTSGNWSDILGEKSAAGVVLNERTALQIPAVYACVTLLSEIMASLPLFVYKRLSPKGKARAPDHPLYTLLHDEANPEMSAMIWRELSCGHMLQWGNAYSEIEFDEDWRPKAFWPLRPDHTFPYRDQKTGELFYSTLIPKTDRPIALPAWRVLHVPAFGFDGYVGKSPIRLMMDTFGLAVAVTRYGGKFFSNGARPSGVLTHPGALSEAAQTRLRNSFDVRYGGLENAHRTMVLEEGLDYKQVGIPPDEAQFIESKKFSTTDIARIYRVPPHMIGDLERSTNNNIEHQGIEFRTLRMLPLCVRYEQEFTRKLLTSKEKQKYFIEHLLDGLARGDMASRYTSYSQAVNGGWMSPDEARELENQNPMPNGEGESYRVPANTIPAHKVDDFWESRIKAATAGKGGNTNAEQTGN